MTHDELDRILSADSPVETSTHFARNVMGAIGRAAEEPERRRFPWGRFWAGIAACNVSAGAATVLLSAPEVPLASLAPELAAAAAMLLVGLGIAAIPRVLPRS